MYGITTPNLAEASKPYSDQFDDMIQWQQNFKTNTRNDYLADASVPGDLAGIHSDYLKNAYSVDSQATTYGNRLATDQYNSQYLKGAAKNDAAMQSELTPLENALKLSTLRGDIGANDVRNTTVANQLAINESNRYLQELEKTPEVTSAPTELAKAYARLRMARSNPKISSNPEVMRSLNEKLQKLAVEAQQTGMQPYAGISADDVALANIILNTQGAAPGAPRGPAPAGATTTAPTPAPGAPTPASGAPSPYPAGQPVGGPGQQPVVAAVSPQTGAQPFAPYPVAPFGGAVQPSLSGFAGTTPPIVAPGSVTLPGQPPLFPQPSNPNIGRPGLGTTSPVAAASQPSQYIVQDPSMSETDSYQFGQAPGIIDTPLMARPGDPNNVLPPVFMRPGAIDDTLENTRAYLAGQAAIAPYAPTPEEYAAQLEQQRYQNALANLGPNATWAGFSQAAGFENLDPYERQTAIKTFMESQLDVQAQMMGIDPMEVRSEFIRQNPGLMGDFDTTNVISEADRQKLALDWAQLKLQRDTFEGKKTDGGTKTTATLDPVKVAPVLERMNRMQQIAQDIIDHTNKTMISSTGPKIANRNDDGPTLNPDRNFTQTKLSELASQATMKGLSEMLDETGKNMLSPVSNFEAQLIGDAEAMTKISSLSEPQVRTYMEEMISKINNDRAVIEGGLGLPPGSSYDEYLAAIGRGPKGPANTAASAEEAEDFQ